MNAAARQKVSLYAAAPVHCCRSKLQGESCELSTNQAQSFVNSTCIPRMRASEKFIKVPLTARPPDWETQLRRQSRALRRQVLTAPAAMCSPACR